MFHPLWSVFIQVCVSEGINGRWRKNFWGKYISKGEMAPGVILSASSPCMKRVQPCGQTTSRTHTCRCFETFTHWITLFDIPLCPSPKSAEREKWVCSLRNPSGISGISPYHHCPVVVHPLGEQNMLNCRSEVAMVFVLVCLLSASLCYHGLPGSFVFLFHTPF